MDRNELVSFTSVKPQPATLLLATSVWGVTVMIGAAAAEKDKTAARMKGSKYFGIWMLPCHVAESNGICVTGIGSQVDAYLKPGGRSGSWKHDPNGDRSALAGIERR